MRASGAKIKPSFYSQQEVVETQIFEGPVGTGRFILVKSNANEPTVNLIRYERDAVLLGLCLKGGDIVSTGYDFAVVTPGTFWVAHTYREDHHLFFRGEQLWMAWVLPAARLSALVASTRDEPGPDWAFFVNNIRDMFAVTAEVEESLQQPTAENFRRFTAMAAQVMSPEFRRYEAVFPDPYEAEAGEFKDLMDQVNANVATEWNLQAAADMLGYSVFHFSRLFKKVVGVGFPEYVESCRCRKATLEYLKPKPRSVNIAAACGFSSVSLMSVSIRRHLGLLPSEIKTFVKDETTIFAR